MFSLVVTVISVVLTVALALAALYYGANALLSKADETRVVQYTNEVSQIKAAVDLYLVDWKESPATLQDLVDGGYLRQNPKADWMFSTNFAITNPVQTVEESLCLKFNKKQGLQTIPSCTDPAYQGQMVCCLPSSER